MDNVNAHKVNEEAVKKIAERVYDNGSTVINRNDLEEMFPALKESEDERIRKGLLYVIEHHPTLPTEEAEEYIAWLEKQGEQKPYGQRQECADCQFNYAGECKGSCGMKQGELKSTDKVEPKFKMGDWVVYDHRTYQIVELPQGRLINASLLRNGKTEKVPLPYCKKWSIQDAKDGDVLSYENEIFIVKKSVNINILYYCCYDREHFIIDSFYSLTIDDIDNIRPATKEQRDLLFQKMHEAGYEWDAEKKELKKIEQKPNFCHHEVDFSGCSEEYRKAYYDGWNNCNQQHAQLEAEQKPAWSEEDETTKNNISHIIRQYDKISKRENKPCWYIGDCLLWMQNIKDRVLPQPKQEWSEEDERIYQSIMDDTVQENQLNDKQTNWLKSIKERVLPQPKHEWSEEDEEMYKEVLTDIIYAKNNLEAKECLGLSKGAMEAFNWFSKRYKSLRLPNTWKPSDEQMEALKEACDEHWEPDGLDPLYTLYQDLKKIREE